MQTEKRTKIGNLQEELILDYQTLAYTQIDFMIETTEENFEKVQVAMHEVTKTLEQLKLAHRVKL